MKISKLAVFLLSVMFMFMSAAFCIQSVALTGDEAICTRIVEETYEESLAVKRKSAYGVSAYAAAEFDGCYGNQLTGVAKEVYDSFVNYYVKEKKTDKYIHSFKTPFTFDALVFAGSILTNDALEKVQLEISYAMQTAMDAFLYDHPEIYWLENMRTSYSISATSNKDGGYTGIIEKVNVIPVEIYIGASSKTDKFNSAVEAVTDSITVTESRYDTFKYIHDYICNNAWYYLAPLQRVHSCEPFFIGDGGVVCEGYAKAFKVICDRLGLPCVLVSGDAGGAHMWNYVQMDDGKWYLVDITWDDQDSGISDTYFIANAGTIGFDGVTVTRERTTDGDFSGAAMFIFAYPELSASAYTAHTHEWESDYTVDTAPTCTVKGSKSIHCKHCIETKSVTEIPVSDHDYKKTVKAPTCTAKGYTTYTCKSCGSSRKADYVNAKGHTYTSKVTKTATCIKTGVKTYTCTCGDSYTEAIAKTSHKYSSSYTVDKKATYKSTGSKSKHCLTDGCTAKKDVKTIARLVLKKVSGLKVTPSTTSLKLSWSKVTGAEKYEVYYSTNGKSWKKISTTKNSATIKKLKSGTSYKLKVRAVAGSNKGSYSSVLSTATKPSKVSLSKVTAGNSKLTVSWKTVSGASGYQVMYSPSSKFKSSKTETVKKGSSKKATIKKLKKGKKYYVKVRAYKTVGDKKIYGAWSAVKSVKVK